MTIIILKPCNSLLLDKLTLIGLSVGSIAIISAVIWLLAEYAGISFKMLEP